MDTLTVIPDRRWEADTFFGEVEEDEVSVPKHQVVPVPKYQFLSDAPEYICKPLQPGFLCAEELLSTAADLPFLPLQAIHISQALMHLLITLANSIPLEKEITREDLTECLALRRLGDDLDDIFVAIQDYSNDDGDTPYAKWQLKLDDYFRELCAQRYGVGAVVQSQETFRRLKELDERNYKSGLSPGVETRQPYTSPNSKIAPTETHTGERESKPPGYTLQLGASLGGHAPSRDGYDAKSRSVLGARMPGDAQEMERNNIIRELVETERKYVQDLEVMQNYARTLIGQGIVDRQTVSNMFPSLNQLLDFQRKFSLELEQQYELSWEHQRWGHCFSTNEEGFAVYELYCANYTTAADLVLAEEPHLMQLAQLLHPKSELPAFLIKPVSRICKYPLLLEALLKRCPTTHEHYKELIEGIASSKWIVEKVNNAQRQAENIDTVKRLEKRIEDWRGHALINFGELILDGVFIVTRSDVERVYHVFLFEKVILCCKDATPPSEGNKKVGKINSIFGKQKTPSGLLDGGAAAARKKTTPLLMKGRIFINNATEAKPINKIGSYILQVRWRGDDDLEFFDMHCRSEEQVKQWEAAIMGLVSGAQSKPNERYSQASFIYPNRIGRESIVSSSASSVSTLPPYSQRISAPQYYPSTSYYDAYSGGMHVPGQQPYLEPKTQQGEWRDGFDDPEEREEDWDEEGQQHNTVPESLRLLFLTSGREAPINAANSRRGGILPEDSGMGIGGERIGGPIRIKVYWLDDLFIIMVPRSISLFDLVQRIQKKMRLCGGGYTDGPLRLRYDDEDGDRISLSTDEELQVAFDMAEGLANDRLTIRVSETL